MTSRQTSIPRQWLIVDASTAELPWASVRELTRQSGILVLDRGLKSAERAWLLTRLRRIAVTRGLVIAIETAGQAARVHDIHEIRRAGLANVPVLFLSPVFPTRSHPEWAPLSRMRAAALLRLANVPVIALGGMDARRFRRVSRLGFYGWAGIDAWNART